MRIGFVYDAAFPYVRGGAERRYYEIGRRLARRHEVHHITWQHWVGPADIVEEGVHLHGLGRAPAFYGDDGKRTVAEAVRFTARLIPYLLRHRFDIIDCSATPYVPLYGAWLATRSTRTPLVATWHEYWGERWSDYLPERPAVAFSASRIESTARLLGDALVAVSPFTARHLATSARSRPLEVIPNGVSAQEIDDTADQARDVDVAYLGRLIDEKRVDSLIDAIGMLRTAIAEPRCVIAGDGPELDQLRRRVVEQGLSAHVEFRSQLTNAEAVSLLKRSRVLVQPSIREGFGMTVLEAQACGAVPVVVRSEWSGASDLVTHGSTGVVCEPSATSIATALEALLKDPARLSSMSADARRTAAAYDWEPITARMEIVYADCIRAEPATAAEERMQCS